MVPDLHINDFYKDVGLILLHLYAYFPRKSTLYVEDISGPDSPDEFGLHSPRHQSCFSTIIWLADAGYLQYQDCIRQEAVDQVVLSHKAFTLLSSHNPEVMARLLNDDGPFDKSDTEETRTPIPTTILDTTLSNINQLREALKSNSSSRIRHCVHQLLIDSKNY